MKPDIVAEIDMDTISSALCEIAKRIEACGSSPELTHAASLACDLAAALRTPPLPGAMERVRITLARAQGGGHG